MSTLDTYRVLPNGDLAADRYFKNSWGGAFRIWHALATRHLGVTYMRLSIARELQKIWDLVDRPQVPAFARRVHESTFDHKLIGRGSLLPLADDYERFEREYPVDGGEVSHLPALAAWMRDLARQDILGVCFRWDSSSCSLWSTNEEHDLRPFNLYRDAQRVGAEWAELWRHR